ncbi:Cytochrome P450 E-class group I [Penicillium concentricum]|uniref:Cytochrome P450 E-class group I n=1 Tax=Penicillium concentricum TaxID=293559 RepID=A0A9W9RBW2_9EURO|nr:Cytochrome P450 E-class group I [Penicillium concentricum]KAJ5356014.1 Cytochrome P450 E-class group I [Penicillium concentricum]
MIIIYFTLALLLGLLGLYTLKSYFISSNSLPLPPGPPRIPIIGNFFDFPKSGSNAWEHWLKHKDLYGPISSLVTAGRTLIILNKAEMAIDLMEKRSAIYSSRPQSVFCADLVGWKRMVVVNGDAAVVRTHRKYITGLLGSKNSILNRHTQLDLGARYLLLQILQQPDSLIENIRRFTGASILDMVYGYKVEPSGTDSLVDLAELSTSQFSIAMQPGAWVVDRIPILKYLPAWFPGAGFQHTAREWADTLTTLAEKPYAFVLHQRSKKKAMDSYVSRHLDALDNPATPEEKYVIKWTAAIMYAGAADTTVSAVSTFFLAMALFPDAQRQAQAELDRVVGSRLPTIDDRPNLPYVDALMKEVMRWHPVAPLGLPHMTTEEDEYCGYRIPKGAVLVPNVWSFTHDPEMYNQPMSFNPGRFLQHENGPPPEFDPQKLVFGFGRRICPGRYLADASLFITISKLLAVFNISKGLGEDGKEMDFPVGFQPGMISHPSPFRVQIRPRSEHAQMLIRSVDTEEPWLKGDSEIFDDIKF